MRVAIINSIRVCGGGEKWLIRQAGCWRERGHEPLVVCQPGSGVEGIARDAGLPVSQVVMRHDVSPVAMAGIAGVLRRFRPSVVLCCNERAFRLAAPASRLAGAPRLIYRNGLTGTFKNRSLNRFLFRWAERMVVISEPLRQEMAGYGWIQPAKLQVIRNGIDPMPYRENAGVRERVRREAGTFTGAVVAAVVARVTEDKGQVETIQALASLTGEYPQAELWIVGEGSLRPRLEELARELGVAARVRFLGFRQDVAAVFQAADLIIQASHREGLGNTLLEAMASARPIVASAVGGILVVVMRGETGELVPPYDAAALAAAWRSLLADPEMRRRYGLNGLRRVEQFFPLTGETDQWCALFEGMSNVKCQVSNGPAREVLHG